MTLNKKLIFALLFVLVLVNSSIIRTDNDDSESKRNEKESSDDENSENSENSESQNLSLGANSNANKNAADPSQREKGKKYGLQMTFEDFKKQHKKKYKDDAQEAERKANFERNKKTLEEFDCENCGVTELFDRSQSELEGLNGFLPTVARSQSLDVSSDTTGARLLQSIPSSFDWRSYGVVTPVKNQGSCGSCWAFAATAFLETEGIRRKQFTNTTQLSDQYLYWCTNSGTWRCNGGDPMIAVRYGLSRGMPLQSTYPYRVGYSYSNICTAPIISSNTRFPNSGQATWYYSTTTRSSDNSMIIELLERALVVAVKASTWYMYRPVLTDPISNKIFSCPETTGFPGLDHAVLLVGYTAQAWIIKNSWGTSWGDRGYIYINRTPSRNCGMGYYWGTVTSNLTRVV